MIECALAWLACMRIRQDGRPQGPATATAVSAVTTPPTPRARELCMYQMLTNVRRM